MNYLILSGFRTGSSLLFSGIAKNLNLQYITNRNLSQFNCAASNENDTLFHAHYYQISNLHFDKVIISCRRDIIKQAISMAIAKTQNIWNIWKHKKQEIPIVHEKYYPIILKQIPSNISFLKSEKVKCKNFVHQHKLPYQIIYYEDLVNDYENTIRNSIKFLFNIELNIINSNKLTIKLDDPAKNIIYDMYKKSRNL